MDTNMVSRNTPLAGVEVIMIVMEVNPDGIVWKITNSFNVC